MKKTSLCLLCILLAMTILAGCGKKTDSPYVGKWVCTTISYEEVQMNAADLFGEETPTLDLLANGKMKLQMGEDKSSGTWEDDAGKIVIYDKTDAYSLGVDEKAQTLTLQLSGMLCTFGRAA